MPSPFPGMDPYLEDPELWRDVHHERISAVRRHLSDQVLPRYVVRVESRVYVAGPGDLDGPPIYPDVQIEKKKRARKASSGVATVVRPSTAPVPHPYLVGKEVEEHFLTVRDPAKAVVAVIEVVSPSNKAPGSTGRREFLAKRDEVVTSNAHLVEIDLLRAGERSPADPVESPADYRVAVVSATKREWMRLWPIRLKDPLPVIGVPLKPPDADAPIDLGAVLADVYAAGHYEQSVNYRKPPVPPLPRALAGWANKLLREKGLR
jgi:hypothetical protein